MIDKGQIREWKKKHGKIYSIEDRGKTYVFRELTMGEYRLAEILSESEGSAGAEDYIVETALLHPDLDLDRSPAALVSAVAEEIMNISGMGDINYARETLNRERSKAQELPGLMKAFILSTMPYTEEQLDEMTFSDLAAKVALAEQIIKLNQISVGIENDVSLDFLDEEEQIAAQQAAQHKHAATKQPGQAGYQDPIAEKLHHALG